MQSLWKRKAFDVKACFAAGNTTSQGFRGRYLIWLPSFRPWSRKQPEARKLLVPTHPASLYPHRPSRGAPFPHSPSPTLPQGEGRLGSILCSDSGHRVLTPAVPAQPGLWWRGAQPPSRPPGRLGATQHLREGGRGDWARGNLPGLYSRQYMKSMQIRCKNSMQINTPSTNSSFLFPSFPKGPIIL